MTAQSYFIIGTDTNVGKTYIASALIRHFVAKKQNVVGMKPVASGCELSPQGDLHNQDVEILRQASNLDALLDLINPYCFEPAIAPHIAAQQGGVTIDLDVILASYRTLSTLADVVIVEGAGGFFVPLNARQTLADLALKLSIPVILVVGMRLGCINHALLTVEAIKARGLTLAGWVANQIDPAMDNFDDNIASLKQRIHAPCLSVVRWQQPAHFSL